MSTVKSGRYTWYVEPDDSGSSQLISDLLHQPPDRECYDIRCGDGKTHNLYEVTSVQLSFLRRSRKKPRPRFKIWRQEGRDGQKLLHSGQPKTRKQKKNPEQKAAQRKKAKKAKKA